jgi:hypothetical protein
VFSPKDDYRKKMIQKLIYISIPLLLTGCVGSFFTGQSEYFGEGYPDIRTVPGREEALAPRGLHEGEEAASRAGDVKRLAQDWEKINARDKALREGAFPAKDAESTLGDKDAL